MLIFIIKLIKFVLFGNIIFIPLIRWLIL